jgi:hypothetical protein
MFVSGVLWGLSKHYDVELIFLGLEMVGTIIFFIFINKNKTPIELTDEERKAPIQMRQEFNNKNFKKDFLFFELVSLGILLFMFNTSYVIEMIADGKSWEYAIGKVLDLLKTFTMNITFITMFVILSVLLLREGIRYGKNKYIVDGDMFIIQENRIWKKEEEIRIPINSIDELYVRGFARWSLHPNLVIKVDGIEKILACSNGKEIGKAILKHKMQ